MTLQDSFAGNTITKSVSRVILNKACQSIVCTHCSGTGVVVKTNGGNDGAKISATVTSPCPECYGLGFCGLNKCSLYLTVQELVDLTLPAGFLPGHKVVAKHKGNEVLTADHKTVTGDFTFTVSGISTGNYSVTTGGDVELTVQISPQEAFEVRQSISLQLDA